MRSRHVADTWALFGHRRRTEQPSATSGAYCSNGCTLYTCPMRKNVSSSPYSSHWNSPRSLFAFVLSACLPKRSQQGRSRAGKHTLRSAFPRGLGRAQQWLEEQTGGGEIGARGAHCVSASWAIRIAAAPCLWIRTKSNQIKAVRKRINQII